MIGKVKVKSSDPTELEKIQALADEIKRHKERMMELINAEAAKDKLSARGLPLEMLVQDICKYGRCECDAMLLRLAANFRAAELVEKARADRAANG